MSRHQEINIRKANTTEIDWINSKYRAIGFAESDYTTEYIILAEILSIPSGLGRLTEIDEYNLELGGIYVFDEFRGMGVADKIVEHLVSQTNPNQKVWCLPFVQLSRFYSRFGFKEYRTADGNIPDKITSKLDWCEQKYDDKVLLLVK